MSLRPRRALLGALYAAIPCGGFYGFALYSAALKIQFDLTQNELDNINTVPYLFGVLGPLWGWLGGLMGPRLALAVALEALAAAGCLAGWQRRARRRRRRAGRRRLHA